MTKVMIKGPMIRGCEKCGMTLHIMYIEFDTNYINEPNVEIQMMCGHGHKHTVYMSSEYSIEMELNKIDWDTVS